MNSTKSTTNADKIKVLREIADETGSDFEESYSGRGMYGAECVGITCDDPDEILMKLGEHGFKDRPSEDSMGRQFILYWPRISVETASK